MRRKIYFIIIALFLPILLQGEALKIGAMEFELKDASLSFKEHRTKIDFSIGKAKLRLSKLNASLYKRRKQASFDLASSSLQLNNIILAAKNDEGDIKISLASLKLDVKNIDFAVDRRERLDLKGFRGKMSGKKLAINFSGVFADEFMRESGVGLETFVLQNTSADLHVNDFGELKFSLKGKSSIATVSVKAELGLNLERLDDPTIEKLVVVISSLSKEAKVFIKDYNKKLKNNIPYKNGKIILDFSKRKTQKLFD